MKRYWFILITWAILSLTLLGCSTAKKMKQTNRYDHTEQVSKDVESASTLRHVDTTHTDSQRVTITEVEFYPPPTAGDTITAIIALDGIGRIEHAPIRWVRQTVIETVVEEKGESLEAEEKVEEVVRGEVVIHSKETVEEQEPPPRHYGRYLLYAGLAVAILLLYLNRTRLWGWLITFICK